LVNERLEYPSLYSKKKKKHSFTSWPFYLLVTWITKLLKKKTDLSIKELKHQLTLVQSKILSSIEKPKDSLKLFFDFINGIDCGKMNKNYVYFLSKPFLSFYWYLIWNLSWLATWKHQVKELQTSHHFHQLQLTSNNLLNTWEHS